MFRRRAALVLVALGLLAGACSSSEGDPAASTTTTPATTGATSTLPSTTTTVSPETTVPTTEAEASAGAPGIGDAYYPHLGNGGYDVEHYAIELEYLGEGAIESTTTIEATATQDLSTFNLDFTGFDIEDLTVDGLAAGFERAGGELIIEPETAISSGSTMVVEIRYAGDTSPFPSATTPIPIGWLEGPDAEQYVMGVADGAHSWFPANDHPIDKATYSFDLTVPEGYLAAANGELTSESTEDGLARYEWTMSDPMASYLATVVIGEGYTIVDDPGSSDQAGIEVRNVLPADLAAAAPDALAKTGAMIEAAEEWFGPYPFDRYGIAVAGDIPAALETQTLSVFGRPMVESPIFEFVLIHELAHQWFGDSVSLAAWEDIWLNEGFATMAEFLWIEHEFGADAYREEVARRSREVAATNPPPPGEPPPGDLFNSGVYQRGGLTLVALRERVGDDHFFEILRTYTSRHHDGNVTTADFIAIAEEVSGEDLTVFFAEWLTEEGVPQTA